MCGRYRLKDPKKAFDWLEVAPSFIFGPRYNISPTQRVPVAQGIGKVEEMQWGIVPAWGDGKSRPLINARAESVREKRPFKAAMAQRRCLVPADGFYEWSRVGKRPHFFSIHGGEPFAMAGIWEPGTDLARCCLLTTQGNAVLSGIHDRMPVIVRQHDWEEWCAPGELSEASFTRIVAPYAAEEMEGLEVSDLVNRGGVEDPRCCEARAPGEERPPLKIRRANAPAEEGQGVFEF